VIRVIGSLARPTAVSTPVEVSVAASQRPRQQTVIVSGGVHHRWSTPRPRVSAICLDRGIVQAARFLIVHDEVGTGVGKICGSQTCQFQGSSVRTRFIAPQFRAKRIAAYTVPPAEPDLSTAWYNFMKAAIPQAASQVTDQGQYHCRMLFPYRVALRNWVVLWTCTTPAPPAPATNVQRPRRRDR